MTKGRPAEQLVDYATTLAHHEITDDARRAIKRRLVDAAACALAAADVAPVQAARAVARAATGAPPAHVFVTGEPTTPELAAYAGAFMVRYWDYNDTYLHGGHPSDMLPAVLAMAEITGASGRDTLTALTIAYETFCSLSDATGPVGATAGGRVAISAAIGCGRLLGLDAGHMAEALSLAAASAISPTVSRARRISMWRAGAAASAAQNGVLAAKLAAEGIAGPREVFLALGAGEGDALPPLGGRGRDFRIEHAHLKAFTAEYHAQAAIGAALSLRERAGPAGIDRVVVNVYAHAIGGIGSGDAKWLVEDPDTALHSLPYLVAVALLDGDVSPAQFTDERLAAADVRGLIRRIELREDAALTAQYVAIVAARVEIVTKSGDTLSASCEQPKGHFENPLTDAEIDAKFSRHAEGRLSATAQRRFLELAWGLEHATGVGELLATLKPDAPTP